MTLTGQKIRLSKSFVGSKEAEAAARVVREGYLGMGKEVELFERELADFIGGNRSVVCVSTGTAALHLAAQACGLGPGDEVLIPTITYVASFQAVSATGATPVACDVRGTDCSLDVADAAKRITKHTKAVMPVYYASSPGSLVETYALANQYGLRVIEDAAHAFGCGSGQSRTGSLGDIVCFSFDGIKNITSGEGGAVVTSDERVADYVRDARLLGVEKDTNKRYSGQRSWEFDVAHQGWRYHMSNVFAAIGRVQLSRFQQELAPKRIELARLYQQLLAGVDEITTLDVEYGIIVPHIFPILVSRGNRDILRQLLLDADIECGIHYKPNHLLSYFGGGQIALPQAEAMYQQLLTLPLHPDLDADDVHYIVSAVRNGLRSR